MSRKARLLVVAVMVAVVCAPSVCASEPKGCAVQDSGTGITTGVPNWPGVTAGGDSVDRGTCTYVATVAGGYRATGTWSVTLETGDITIVRNHVVSSPCVGVGFIQPGDRVTVSVRDPGGATLAGSMISAGPGAHC